MIIIIISDVTVKMAEREYTVGEGDGSVEVCVEASGVPAGGLECDLTISLALTDGTKTGRFRNSEHESVRSLRWMVGVELLCMRM